mmetsp:Transcript_115282/g.366523  ORF Transcript_115282/g.366523 Transcript_115282/m.366523 type:complete len:222 (-) Transcript_115282:30-695(-)
MRSFCLGDGNDLIVCKPEIHRETWRVSQPDMLNVEGRCLSLARSQRKPTVAVTPQVLAASVDAQIGRAAPPPAAEKAPNLFTNSQGLHLAARSQQLQGLAWPQALAHEHTQVLWKLGPPPPSARAAGKRDRDRRRAVPDRGRKGRRDGGRVARRREGGRRRRRGRGGDGNGSCAIARVLPSHSKALLGRRLQGHATPPLGGPHGRRHGGLRRRGGLGGGPT